MESVNYQEQIKDLKNLYTKKLNSLDSDLGSLVKVIDQTLGLKNTMLMIMGDHGESIMDDGALGHSYSVNPLHTKVPLYIYDSFLEAGQATARSGLSMDSLGSYLGSYLDGYLSGPVMLEKMVKNDPAEEIVFNSCSGDEFGHMVNGKLYIQNLISFERQLYVRTGSAHDWEIVANFTSEDKRIFDQGLNHYVKRLDRISELTRDKSDPGCLVTRMTYYKLRKNNELNWLKP